MHYSTEEKAMWLEDWKQSGKKAWVYAKENGLIPQTFVGWTKKGIKQKSCFIEIPKRTIQSKLNTTCILIEKGDMKIHIPLGIESVEWHTILAGLGATQ